MKRNFLPSALVVLVLAVIATSAWAAGPDTATLTSITTNPASTMNGQNVTLTGNVNAGDNISLSFVIGVSGSGSTSTSYPHILSLTATTVDHPTGGGNVSVTGLANCTLNNRTATCPESATLVAPSTPGAYQVKILADDGQNGSGRMQPQFFFINFTVAVDQSCTPATTTLTLSTPACTLLHADSVSLSATLKSGDTALVGKTITFLVDGNAVGTDDTDANGVATLNYDPSSLGVGDHTLSTAWQSDDACYENPTVTGDKLGIEYLFLGFQQPINADGSSIFNGRSVPVKIKITDANAGVIPDANALVFFENGIQAIVGTDSENVATGLNFDYGNLMRYDSTANQYVYNWDLSTTTNGTKTVRVFLNEGSCADPHQVVISVGKKK